MPESTRFTLRWGIISTGKIAACFVRDILLDPKTRDVHDIAHRIVAVGSRSADTARKFIETEIKDGTVKAYGSYDELLIDPEVDAVYIGTPHTYHYANSKTALLAGKHVLCEKPVTSNAAELRVLLSLARQQSCFFMEAMWTRFQPLVREVKEIVERDEANGGLGDPVILHADLSGDFDVYNIPKTHRILDPRLGGGALLDLGPYPMVWATTFLYEHSKNHNSRPSSVTGAMLKTPLTGVDSNTSFTLNFCPDSDSSFPDPSMGTTNSTDVLRAQAILSCSITLPPLSPSGVIIRYRGGNVLVAPPIYCPTQYTIQYFSSPGSGQVVREVKKEFKYEGVGWHFQADEVARCVRDRKRESAIWGWEKSLLEMDVFDAVRRQCGYVFPLGVEQVV